MFSNSQWIFSFFFVIVFLIAIILSYLKDKKLHKKYYKGSFWVLIGFIVFVLLLLLIKYSLK
jgi:uncharacterized membrane protein YhaH (DUF805 family)